MHPTLSPAPGKEKGLRQGTEACSLTPGQPCVPHISDYVPACFHLLSIHIRPPRPAPWPLSSSVHWFLCEQWSVCLFVIFFPSLFVFWVSSSTEGEESRRKWRLLYGAEAFDSRLKPSEDTGQDIGEDRQRCWWQVNRSWSLEGDIRSEKSCEVLIWEGERCNCF